MSLIRRAISVAQEEADEKAEPSVLTAPTLPYLCLFELHRSYRQEREEDEEERELSLSHVHPVPLTPPLPSLSLLHSVIEEGGMELTVDDFVHLKAGFDWDKEKGDDEEEEWTGNQGTTTDKFFHRAGILLLQSRQRWRTAAEGSTRETMMATLTAAATRPTFELTEFIQCAEAASAQLSDTEPALVPAFLLQLSELSQRVEKGSNAGSTSSSTLSATTTSSASVVRQQLNSLLDRLMAKSSFDFADSKAAVQFDRLATARGIDWLSPLLVSSFERHLDESLVSTARSEGSSRTLLSAVQFVLRFFFLRPASTSAAPTVASEAPTYPLARLEEEGAAKWAKVPLSWLPTVTELCDILYSHFEDNQRMTAWRMNFAALAELYTAALQLMSCYHWQRCEDPEHSAVYSDRYLTAAHVVCLRTSEAAAAAWRAARAADEKHERHIESASAPLVGFIQDRLVQPLLRLLRSLLDRPRSSTGTDSAQSEFLAAFPHLTQWLDAWLRQQATAPLPLASSWEFPIHTAAVFSPSLKPWSHLAYTSSSGRQWCGCSLCSDLERFLLSPTSEAANFDPKQRSHAVERAKALCNPHLRIDTNFTGKTFTLRLSKLQRLLPLFEQQRLRLEGLRAQLKPIVDAVKSAAEDTSAAAESIMAGASESGERTTSSSGRGLKRSCAGVKEEEKEEEEQSGRKKSSR